MCSALTFKDKRFDGPSGTGYITKVQAQGGAVKPYTSGIRHDYKNDFFERLPRKRYVSWFAAGLAVPIVGVALLLFMQHGEHASGDAGADSVALLADSSAPGSSAAAHGTPSDVPEIRGESAGSEENPAAVALAVDQAAGGAIDVGADVAAAATTAQGAPAQARAFAPALLGPPAAGFEAGGQSVLTAGAFGLPNDADLAAALDGVAAKAGAMLDLVVKQGDSLERLFRRNHLSLADLAEMVRLKDVAEYLKLLKPGDAIHIAHDGERVLGLTRELDEVKLLSIVLGDDGYKAVEIERPVDLRKASGHGIIRTSLFDAASKAGISDAVTMSMAGIFQWDIDFIQDVREGDSFTVIYEQRWRDGIRLGNGPILAAEFMNQGRTYRAALYTDAAGHSDYYTPDGRSLRKAFIRAPVDFTRISSNFDLNRRHPILNTIRAHRGVDYAAPIGTPVRAAGDGKVLFRGVKGGYGNVVILQHGGNITTLYGHLSKFGKYKVGSRVRQGDVIAYVGKTGLATGPHLHYEYRVAGVHRNPRTVSLPPADPVPAQYRKDFETKTAELWQALDTLDGGEPNTELAAASD
jgi:murein DD-endopeptidase MepM/ murein hydrolase activator NlpD